MLDPFNLHKKLFFLSFLILPLLQINLYCFAGDNKKEKLFLLVNDCLTKLEKTICMKALSSLEILQLEVADNENYSCQTRLLALQSDVIIAMSKFDPKHPYPEIIKELKEFCNNE